MIGNTGMQTASRLSSYTQGIFKCEIKNRFLCLVDVDGDDVVCYIPSSCRLSNFIDLTNRIVLLLPTKAKNARTQYAVFAVKYRNRYVLLNMTHANRIIEEQINRRFFSFLGKRKFVTHEAFVEGYKSDLYIEDSNTVIEIKSILSFDKKAKFPTVYSERAICQFAKMKELLDKGYKVCYIFVSLNPGVKQVEINQDIGEYYNLFTQCVEKGMMYCGFSIDLKNESPYVYSKINIDLDKN